MTARPRSVLPSAAGSAATVLHFKADWLPASEVFVYDLVRNLRHPAVVVGHNPLRNSDRFPVEDLHTLAPLERFVRPVSARPFAFTSALDLLIRRRRVSILHAHHGYRLEVLLPLARRRSLPLVLSVHGHDVTGYLDHRPDPYREAADLVSVVTVPSRFFVQHAVAAGFSAERVRVMPSGIDTSYFTPSPLPEGDPVALFVGRFVGKKGIDTLAEAWPQVQSAVPRARLRVLGYGPLESLARSIPGRVSVEIAPDRHAVREAMRAARVIVSPSHTAPDDSLESLLMVNLEAQASGRPVVTTRHGGIPEYVIEEETALVVRENDRAELADALARVLKDDDLAARMSSAGPVWASNFDVRKTSLCVDALYDELLDR